MPTVEWLLLTFCENLLVPLSGYFKKFWTCGQPEDEGSNVL
jgi:hypothetical protein